MNRALAKAAMAAALALWARPALPHPHVFIDVTIEVILDDQDRVTAVRIGWIYDDFFSLSVIADRGLDPDADGVLTAEEQKALSGFDMHWIPDYPGDTYALLGEADLTLGPPEDWTASWDGRQVRTTHLRHLPAPVALNGQTFLVQVYDPGYYTAYSIVGDPLITGGRGDCTAEVWVPDPDAADQELKDALAEYAPDQDVEQDFPAVGKAFAEEVRLTCGAD